MPGSCCESRVAEGARRVVRDDVHPRAVRHRARPGDIPPLPRGRRPTVGGRPARRDLHRVLGGRDAALRHALARGRERDAGNGVADEDAVVAKLHHMHVWTNHGARFQPTYSLVYRLVNAYGHSSASGLCVSAHRFLDATRLLRVPSGS